MEYTIKIDRDYGYALITTSGRATGDGFVRMTRELWEHPLWSTGMNLLLDHRPLDSTGLTAEEIRRIAQIREKGAPPFAIRKVASVVETDLGFGLTRMWEFYSDRDRKQEHRIFRSIEDARRWLQEDPPLSGERTKETGIGEK